MPCKHFYHQGPLAADQPVTIADALAHRLTKVLRLPDGAGFCLFNGHDGLFEATLTDSRRRQVSVHTQVQLQPVPVARFLAVGLPKKDTFAEVLRQATELGVSDIYPLLTRYAVPDRLNADKAQQKLIEAAEQCERLTIPVLHPLQPLSVWLTTHRQPTLWGYERLSAVSTSGKGRLNGVLIGPEGGFSPEEVSQLEATAWMQPTRLGAHILRVDTAAVAALCRLEAYTE